MGRSKWLCPAVLGILAGIALAEQAAAVTSGCNGRGVPASAPADVRWHDWPHTDTNFQPRTFVSLAEWEARREWLRQQVRVAAGLWPEPKRKALNEHIFGRIEGDGYTIEKVYFESYPGFYVTGNLYRPDPMPAGKIPAIACPHGHWANGRLHQDEVGNIPARCITLARMGATVFAYDMIGYNDSKRQIDHRINTPERDLWGITSLHLQTWNSIRVLDFLHGLPEVDPQRIGVTGASGGGTQTFILSAIDDRVSVAAPVNMISHTMQGGCVCENAPCLRIDANNMEIGALLAPKPLLMVSATGDWTKDTPQVEFPMIRSIYELYSTADRVANVHINAGHNYNRQSREAMYLFFHTWLLNNGRQVVNHISEGAIPVHRPEDLLVWTDETAPKDLLPVEKLTEQLKADARAVIADLKPMNREKYDAFCEVVRAGLEHVLASPFRQFEEYQISIERGRFYGQESLNQPSDPGTPGEPSRTRQWFRRDCCYERKGRRVSGVEIWPPIAETGIIGADKTILVNADGREAADAEPVVINGLIGGKDLRDLRIPILIEPFGVGPAPTVLQADATQPAAGSAPGSRKTAGTRGSTPFFTTFNRCDVAETAYDVLTVLAAELNGNSQRGVNLLGVGRLGPVSLLARALVPEQLVMSRHLRTVIDMNRFDIESDAAYLKDLNIPHIQRLGGLRAIAAVACNGPIWFHNLGEHFDAEWVQAAGRENGVEVKVTWEKADAAAIAAWLMK